MVTFTSQLNKIILIPILQIKKYRINKNCRKPHLPYTGSEGTKLRNKHITPCIRNKQIQPNSNESKKSFSAESIFQNIRRARMRTVQARLVRSEPKPNPHWPNRVGSTKLNHVYFALHSHNQPYFLGHKVDFERYLIEFYLFDFSICLIVHSYQMVKSFAFNV